MQRNPHRIAQSHSTRMLGDLIAACGTTNFPKPVPEPDYPSRRTECPGSDVLPLRRAPGICSNREQAKPTIITRRGMASEIGYQGFA